MSRSRKKTPIRGWTTARSEKPFKRYCARAARKAESDALAQVDESCDYVEIKNPTIGRWGPKDGKAYWGDEFPEYLRK